MEFQYVAYTDDRKVFKGTQTAADADVAANVLASHGYKVLSLKPLPRFLPRWEQIFPYFNRVPRRTVILFSRQLALLLESGTQLVTALELLKSQSTNRRLKTVLADVASDIRKGERLSSALGKQPDVFDRMYVQSVAVGEQAGGLESVLRQMADYMEKEENASKSVKNALRYPAIVSLVAIAVLAVLTVFVLPAFSSLYSQLGVQLPTLTRSVFSAVEWFTHNGLYLLGGLLIAGLVVYVYGKTPEGKFRLDGIVLKLPLMGRIVHLGELARCCRSMAILHRSGLPVSEIMGMVIESAGNLQIKQALTQVHQGILRGQGLSGPMTRNKLFLPMMVQMVGVGEATGTLETTLTATAASYEAEADDRMHSITEMIQPAVTVVLAVIVALIAAALISAMYSIYGSIGSM